MSTFKVLDAYSSLRRELALVRSAEIKEASLGHNQMVLLYRLSQGNAPLNELAAYTFSDKASTSRTVASLEKAGYVRKVAHESDGRITLIELTAKGRKKAELAHEVRKLIGGRVEKTLTSAEQKTLAELLNKVVLGLQAQRNP